MLLNAPLETSRLLLKNLEPSDANLPIRNKVVGKVMDELDIRWFELEDINELKQVK